jgi:NAD(P)-dependent dehydrogenase (short-subunit alcohol dehydrogenase family)
VLADVDLAGMTLVKDELALVDADRVLIHECDITDDAQLERVVACTVEWGEGRIDGLVNNAGINFAKPFLDTTPVRVTLFYFTCIGKEK